MHKALGCEWVCAKTANHVSVPNITSTLIPALLEIGAGWHLSGMLCDFFGKLRELGRAMGWEPRAPLAASQLIPATGTGERERAPEERSGKP